ASSVRLASERREPPPSRHMERVEPYSAWLGEQLGLHPEDRQRLHVGALLHEIGRIAAGDSSLHAAQQPSDIDLAAMKKQILKGVALAETLPDLEPVLPIIRSHHERWDGAGYPDGLAGEKIPLLARIVAIADAFDAITSDKASRA